MPDDGKGASLYTYIRGLMIRMLLFFAAALLSVAATIIGDRGDRGLAAPGVRLVKTLVTLLVLAAAVTGYRMAEVGLAIPNLTSVLVLVGLGFTVVADWLLAPVDNSKTFPFGLAAFLVGYLLYGIGLVAAALGALAPRAGWGLPLGTYGAVLGLAVLQWVTLPNVPKTLRLPVILYILVASNLLVGGVLLLRLVSVPLLTRVMVLAGTTSVYLSDSLIAHNLFRRPLVRAELWIMPTYYVGQLAIVAGLFLFR